MRWRLANALQWAAALTLLCWIPFFVKHGHPFLALWCAVASMGSGAVATYTRELIDEDGSEDDPPL